MTTIAVLVVASGATTFLDQIAREPGDEKVRERPDAVLVDIDRPKHGAREERQKFPPRRAAAGPREADIEAHECAVARDVIVLGAAPELCVIPPKTLFTDCFGHPRMHGLKSFNCRQQ